MLWVVLILVFYFVMTNVFIYGLDQATDIDIFAQYRAILAGAQGSLMHLGIGPIVTASIIMQLFVGAKIIKLDLTNKEDKAVYQSTQKFLVIIMILVEAVPQVFGYLVPSDHLRRQLGTVWSARAGLLNGTEPGPIHHHPPAVRRFLSRVPHGRGRVQMGHRERHIAVHRRGRGASHIHRYGQLGAGRRQADPLSLSNPPAGTIPKTLLLSCQQMSAASWSSGGYERILLAESQSDDRADRNDSDIHVRRVHRIGAGSSCRWPTARPGALGAAIRSSCCTRPTSRSS